jgi:predicted site-specific integrase-resolvase
MIFKTKKMSERLGVSVETLRDWTNKGLIPVRKLTSKTWLYDTDLVNAEFMDGMKKVDLNAEIKE